MFKTCTDRGAGAKAKIVTVRAESLTVRYGCCKISLFAVHTSLVLIESLLICSVLGLMYEISHTACFQISGQRGFSVRIHALMEIGL